MVIVIIIIVIFIIIININNFIIIIIIITMAKGTWRSCRTAAWLCERVFRSRRGNSSQGAWLRSLSSWWWWWFFWVFYGDDDSDVDFYDVNGDYDKNDSQVMITTTQVMQCTQLRRIDLERSFLIDCRCCRFFTVSSQSLSSWFGGHLVRFPDFQVSWGYLTSD